jgi:hypothetical protein
VSTDTRRGPTPSRGELADGLESASRLPEGFTWFRLASLLGVLVLTGSYVSVLNDIARVAGGSDLLIPLVVATGLAGAVLARYIGPRIAGVVGIVLGILGYWYYLSVTPVGIELVIARADGVLLDGLALLTGLPIIRLIRADVWALAFVPGPVFVSWYLAVRRRYVAGVAVGGIALAFLVLSGDAGAEVTLAGVLGGVAAVGFGELDRRNGSLLQADVLVVLVALIMVTSVGASVVAGSGANPIDPTSSGIAGGTATVEGSLIGSSDRVQLGGSISLSPEVRFTVRAEEGRYWRTGSYDRYTGDGWVRTGREREYDGPLAQPPGPRTEVFQNYTAESRVATMPAAAEPVRVVGDATENTMVTEQGTLQAKSTFIEGDQYHVYSSAPDANPSMLKSAGTDYPEEIEEGYTQLPADTPDRVERRTSRVTESADNPYESAVLIERYLERNKQYSLEVERPDGTMADSFLFEMDAGYCTYFATTMVTMLRSQGIPARLAVGYTSGQQVGENEWVVRGLDSHAWVEVYFPGYGWIQFDPTPGGPRQSTELETIRDAREDGGGGAVDTDESEDAPLTTTTVSQTGGPENDTNGTSGVFPGPNAVPGFEEEGGPNGTGGNVTINGSGTTGSEGGGLPGIPSPRDTAVGGAVLFAVAAGAHRFGLTDRAYEGVRIRWHGDPGSPEADAERAFERLELLLARRYRERRTGETPREYVDALAVSGLDKRARTVFETYERAKYAGSVDRERADEAVALVDEFVAESTPLLRRLRR